MRWRVIARYRSPLRTMAFILFGKLIAEAFDIHFELASDHVSRSGRIILSIMSCPGIGTPVWQFLVYTELLRHESPILVEPLKFSDEIGQHISVRIDKPIQLIAMRRRVNAGCTAVLDPIDKLFECHLVSELQRFGALIERDNAIPRIAHKSELEVRLELFAPNFSPSLFRKKQIQSRYYPVLSSAVPRPIHLHLVFNLPQIQMRFPCLAKNGPDAGRASLWHLNKDAFVLMRDHCAARPSMAVIKRWS